MQTLNGQQWRQMLVELNELEPAVANYISAAAQTVEKNLAAHDCSAAGIQSTQQFVQHALVLVAIAVRDGQRKLMEDWLPEEGIGGGGTETNS
jgi:hypothetical protein